MDTVIADFEGKTAPILVGFGDPGPIVASVVVDPADATNNALQLVKPDTAASWAGATVAFCENDSIVELPFSATETTMSVRVWSPDAATPFLLKVEDASDGGINSEVLVSSTTAKT